MQRKSGEQHRRADPSNPYRQRGYIALALVAMVLTLCTPFIETVSAQDERVTVRLDGRSLFRVGPLEDQAASERARQIERRLQTLLENPDAIAPAVIERSAENGNVRIISVSGVPVVTVTQNDADDNLASVDAVAEQWSVAIDRALERAGGRRLSPWGRFTAETQGAVETAFRRVGESALQVIPRALAALLVIGVFWGIAIFTRWFMRLIFHYVLNDLTLENLIKQIAYYAVWTLGIIVAIDALGFDPETVAAGLGLTGLALGFALRDILSNFVSGILILMLRPFEIGDQIVVGETEGSVQRIQLRATQIRTYDGRVILVPNAELFTSRVTNNTAAPVRRGGALVHLGYDSALDHAIDVIRAATQATEGVLEAPAPSVRVRELGQNDIIVEARFWADSRRSDFVLTSSAVRRSIVLALSDADIGLPNPDIRVIIPGNAKATPEPLR